ncbi:MAG: hypothetical protein JW861_10280 [Bacteroidales bacterium]|nr:hypothetical protein [Bacteroidales bacterium]
MKDLIVLAADKDIEFLLRGLFPRLIRTEHIKNFSFDPFVHPYRDPGVYHQADDFLRSHSRNYSYAMVVLDRSGCGAESLSRVEIEESIEKKLFQSGWEFRACAIVIDPELENWIWVNEVRIREAVSWEFPTDIYNWLHSNNWKDPRRAKPSQPKEAFLAVMKECRTPRSSSVYQ